MQDGTTLTEQSSRVTPSSITFAMSWLLLRGACRNVQLYPVSTYIMDFLTEFIKSKKDLIAKSPEGYEYEIEIRLKDVTEKEFIGLPKVTNIITTEETLYSVKGSSTVTVREINSEFFIKEKISSRIIPKFNAEVVLSLELRHHKEEGMALRIKRNKERGTISYNKFKIDSTRVVSKAHTHYEIELELLDDDCEVKLLELALERIRPSTVPQIFKLINKLVPSLDLRSYKFPKPVDMTVKELTRNYSSGGSVSLKLDGTRSFLACYEATVYAISTKGEETIIESDGNLKRLLIHYIKKKP
uniref:mRNA 5'-phosphatase n=1 Tax=Physcomitrium patens TaxID=3218 RepID=A0A2K1L230_PHYPA|nr:hypothetical protein PHYPA_002854 [Physcomitrium patens]